MLHRARTFPAITAVAAIAALLTTSCLAELGETDDEHEDEPVVESEEQLRSGVDCTQKSVTGYRRGSPYAMKVVTVGGKPTALATAHAFLRWQAAADRAGVSLSINSGFRSMDQQRYLYDCYRTKKCNNGNLAARPGYSNHQNGEALDLATNNWSWVRKTAAGFGFRATVPSERWHYEYRGADPGGICSAGAGAGAGTGTGTGTDTDTDTGTGTDEADDDDGATDSADSGGVGAGACSSATLGKTMPEGACVQSSSTELWYQCEAGRWYRGVSNGVGPYGPCTEMHGL